MVVPYRGKIFSTHCGCPECSQAILHASGKISMGTNRVTGIPHSATICMCSIFPLCCLSTDEMVMGSVQQHCAATAATQTLAYTIPYTVYVCK